ncbi:MAG: OmpW family outer membrane protein [bacterium]
MKTLATAVMATSLMLTGQAYSYDKGDLVLRVGAATVNPTDDNAKNVGGTGLDLSVNDNTQLGINVTYMLTDDIGIGVLGATPFNHDISLNGGVGKIAETDHLPPTVTVQYHFDNSSNLKPFVGAGFNYTVFFDEDLNSTGDTLGTGLSLDNSFGFAAEAGLDWHINDDWMVSAQVWWVDIDTEAKLKNALGGPDLKFDVEIDPWVYMIGVGFRF